jgi:hypothetical protein
MNAMLIALSIAFILPPSSVSNKLSRANLSSCSSLTGVANA